MFLTSHSGDAGRDPAPATAAHGGADSRRGTAMRPHLNGSRLPIRLTTLAAVGAVIIAAGSVPGSSAAATTAAMTTAAAATDDYCLGQCGDILPPGQNGNATLADILAHKTLGTRPAHAADQLDKYANLVYNYAGLTDAQISRFFGDASFGVPSSQVERTEKPRSDVTIVRDKATGIPHVTGTTRAGTMYGAGYAGAEDRDRKSTRLNSSHPSSSYAVFC